MTKRLFTIIMITVGLITAWYIPDLYADEFDVVVCKRELPPPYDPTGKIDPFADMASWNIPMDVEEVEVVKVPDTPLTRLSVQQYDLTSVILGETFRWAFFTSEAGKGRAYKGQEGDFIGKDGAKIKSIGHGAVELTNGGAFTKKAW